MEDELSGPNVTPGSPRGSGRKAPWVVMGVVAFTAVCVISLVLLVGLIWLLRS